MSTSGGGGNSTNMGPGGSGSNLGTGMNYVGKSSWDFKRGDLVWAKVRGYSWWPAKIGEVIKGDRERKFRVDFIGDNTHQTVG